MQVLDFTKCQSHSHTQPANPNQGMFIWTSDKAPPLHGQMAVFMKQPRHFIWYLFIVLNKFIGFLLLHMSLKWSMSMSSLMKTVTVTVDIGEKGYKDRMRHSWGEQTGINIRQSGLSCYNSYLHYEWIHCWSLGECHYLRSQSQLMVTLKCFPLSNYTWYVRDNPTIRLTIDVT